MLGTNLEIIKLNSSKYGNVLAFYDKKQDRLGNGYIVRSMKNFKMLSGYIDLDKNIIIDLDEMAYDNYFFANYGKDICIAFMMPNGIDRYFHIKSRGKSYRLVMQTDPESPLIVTRIEKDDTNWMLTTVSEDARMALYNYNLGKVVTCYLDRIDLVDDSDIHRYYYERNLSGIYEDEKMYATTLCGFLDEHGRFSSDILDAESDNLVYDANLYGSTLTEEFQTLCNTLIVNNVEKQLEKEAEINDIISNMYLNPIEIKENKKAKIIEFNRKKV